MQRGYVCTGSQHSAAALPLTRLHLRERVCACCTRSLARKQQPPPEPGDEAAGGGGRGAPRGRGRHTGRGRIGGGSAVGSGGRPGHAGSNQRDNNSASARQKEGNISSKSRSAQQSDANVPPRSNRGGCALVRGGGRPGKQRVRHRSSGSAEQSGQRNAQRAWDASLGTWACHVRERCGERLQPRTLMGLVKNPKAMPCVERAPQAVVADAVASLQLLLGYAVQCEALIPAVFLGELAASVEAHSCLHRAAVMSNTFVAAAQEAFDAAAAADSTYTDARHVSQLAVAQRRLGMLCEHFWRELERGEHVALDACGLANVYHAYAALAQQRKAAGAASSDALCSQLEKRAVDLKGAFNSQEAANCL